MAASTNIAPTITATNVYILPQEQLKAKRCRAVPSPEKRCRALTQDPTTKKHTGDQCKNRKVFNDDIPQANKSRDNLVADELCQPHKKIQARFTDMVVQQLLREETSKRTANRLSNATKIKIEEPLQVPNGKALLEECRDILQKHNISSLAYLPDFLKNDVEKQRAIQELTEALASLQLDSATGQTEIQQANSDYVVQTSDNESRRHSVEKAKSASLKVGESEGFFNTSASVHHIDDEKRIDPGSSGAQRRHVKARGAANGKEGQAGEAKLWDDIFSA